MTGKRTSTVFSMRGNRIVCITRMDRKQAHEMSMRGSTTANVVMGRNWSARIEHS